MKIFISYRFTGEDFNQLQVKITNLCDGLVSLGHEPICSIQYEDFYRQHRFSLKQMFDHALGLLEASDFVFAFIDSDDRSEGMLIELGYALAKHKPITLAVRKGVYTHTSTVVAKTVFEYENFAQLLKLVPKYF